MTNDITYEVMDGWAHVVLNVPDQRNALSLELLEELASILWDADDRTDVRTVLLSGSGPDFCSGYSLRSQETRDGRRNPNPSGADGTRRFDDDVWYLERRQRALMTLFDMHKPVVAQVHGHCIAGGLDLALLCDLVLVADDAILGFPPARGMGTLPTNMWLANVPVQWARRLLLTGDCLLGRDAAAIGLVLESYPADELADEARRLVERIALIDADILTVNKRSINLALELSGTRTMQRLAAELDARGHAAPHAQTIRKSITDLGLREAIKQRDEPFGHGFVAPRQRG